MQTFTVVRLLLVFAHLMAFAIALGCVLREDAKLLLPQPVDRESLRSAARLVRCALAVLWASGLALIVLDTGGDVARVAANPKLLAKLSVVCVLTANGVALHRLAFPALCGEVRSRSHTPSLAAVLGAISAASWLSAALLGIVRTHARGFDYLDFMLAYAGMLVIATTFALLFVRPRVQRKLSGAVQWPERRRAPSGSDVPRLQ